MTFFWTQTPCTLRFSMDGLDFLWNLLSVDSSWGEERFPQKKKGKNKMSNRLTLISLIGCREVETCGGLLFVWRLVLHHILPCLSNKLWEG